jgi:hypothetical protein
VRKNKIEKGGIFFENGENASGRRRFPHLHKKWAGKISTGCESPETIGAAGDKKYVGYESHKDYYVN